MGILDLIGILTPGAFLLGSIALIFIVIERTDELSIFSPFFSPFLSVLTIFFLIYILGTILRLIHPELVDIIVSLYFKLIRRRKGSWVDDKFPYFYHILKKKYTEDRYDNIASEVSNFILKESGLDKKEDDALKEYSKKKEHKDFFMCCRLFLIEKSPRFSEEVYRAEAVVRLLAGIFWVSLISLFIFLLLFLNTPTMLNLIFFLIYLCITVLILERFRHIRFKEVMTVWESFYLMNK